ncbi:MAG: hypothetical protein N2588_02325 [Rhodovarius sp.]|nr:hypothetical protein [Rhodovarius sp.]
MRPARLALLLGLAACAELAERPPPLPAGLVGTGDPLRAAAVGLHQGLQDGGRSLAGRPEELALALARLEYLAEAAALGEGGAAMPSALRAALAEARAEARSALGIAEALPPQQVMRALLATRRALQAGDRPGAEAALAAIARPGIDPPLRRLSDPGGLPLAALAAQRLMDELRMADAVRTWRGDSLADAPRQGISTQGLGGNTDR